jgi:hypothetical protein
VAARDGDAAEGAEEKMRPILPTVMKTEKQDAQWMAALPDGWFTLRDAFAAWKLTKTVTKTRLELLRASGLIIRRNPGHPFRVAYKKVEDERD